VQFDGGEEILIIFELFLITFEAKSHCEVFSEIVDAFGNPLRQSAGAQLFQPSFASTSSHQWLPSRLIFFIGNHPWHGGP
jgi:hypothetical protein